MIVCTIDPGHTAGLALMSDIDTLGDNGTALLHSSSVHIGNREDLVLTRKQLEENMPSHVILEATSWRAASNKRCAKYNGGVLIGALGLQNLPLSFVQPSAWRSAVLGDSKAGKEEAMNWVLATYGFTPTDHNEAEAVCIAYWALEIQKELGG